LRFSRRASGNSVTFMFSNTTVFMVIPGSLQSPAPPMRGRSRSDRRCDRLSEQTDPDGDLEPEAE
jgi:hypothetical protein